MNRRGISVFIVFVLLTTLSCNFVAQGTSRTPVQDEPSATLVAADSALLDEEFISESGGFSIRKVKGYDFQEVIGIVNMTAPDAQPEVGPVIMVVGGMNDFEMTANELVEKVRSDTSALTLSNEMKVAVGGQEGWSMEVSGTYDGQAVKGRMLVAMVSPRQQFSILAIGPAERWTELEPLFEAVLASVTFFEANPTALEEPEPGDLPEATEQPAVEAPGENPAAGEEIRQWAISATAKSEYGSQDWSAMQAVGEPDVEECGDNVLAWAPLKPTGLDWLEVTFATPVIPTEINIYQSFNPSQVYEVDLIDTQGDTYIIWAGEPEWVDYCPDLMTIEIELDEVLMTQTIRILVDQDALGMGWVEIDAVELVGKLPDGQPTQPPAAQQPAPAGSVAIPTNYAGWMAGPVYQGFLKVVPGQTRVEELDALIGLPGKRSTENWKPRPTHADTFIYDLKQDKMIAWISVDTSGVVYKKSISPNTYPSDFQLDTVNQENYQQLDAIYKRDQVVLYPVMANLLQSPGFLSEQVLREDGRMQTNYQWYNTSGDRIIGMFYDGKLTGIAGLAFIPKQ